MRNKKVLLTIKDYEPILEVFSILIAVAVAIVAVGNNIWGRCAVIYLFIYIFVMRQD